MSDALDKAVSAPPRQFKPYAVYRDSGVEWLGEIPKNWLVRRLKTLISDPITDGPHETPEFLIDGVPFLSVDGIQEGELVFEGCRYISVDAHRAYRRKCAPRRDDILLGKAASTGKIARVKVDLEFSVWSPLALIRPSQAEVWPSYLEYSLKCTATQAQIDILCTSNTQKNISMRDIPILVVSLPTLQEQRAIAAFLDRKTARIDVLVAKKERLIELLREKRTALITRAVTKGLDPNVPMKDSGVEWLGEIPAHWEVRRVKDAAGKIGSGKTPSGGAEVYVPDGVMLLRSQNVHFDALWLDDVAFIDSATDAEMAGSRVREGDVLLNITGASLGRCCVAHLDGRSANVNQHVCVIRPKSGVFDPTFLAAALASRSGQAQIFTTENGISRDALNFEQIGRLAFACPPLEEQRFIAAFLDGETARIDALLANVRDAIERLRELRTALIAAAVTGKIDVREEIA